MAAPERQNIDSVGIHRYNATDDTFPAWEGDVNLQVGDTDVSSGNPVPVTVISGASNTQYTEGDTDASITGTAMMMEGAGNTLVPAQGTAADGLLVNLGSNNDVTVTSSALPSGAATSAKQDTIIGHVDGIEGLLTTIDADTGNISTKIDTIAGAVSGTEVQVDVLTMPTVTVQGVAAHGAAVSGNPVLLGGENPSGNVARLKTASDGDLIIHQHSASTALADSVSNTMHIPVNQTDAGFLGTPTANYMYNGTTWDRIRGETTNGLDVDVTRVIPGTSATNLGKAKDSTVGSTDTGVAVFGRLRYDAAHSTGSDGAYDTFDLTSWHEIRTRDQRQIDIQNCNTYTDFTALNNDTLNIANSLNHVYGTGAVTFDKVNGSANTVFGCITFSVSSLNISSIFEDGAFVTVAAFIPSLTNVDYVFLRLGTDASNYNEWQWDVTDLTANTWQLLRKSTGTPQTYAGNGWDSGNIVYGAVGVAFNSESNTLSGIVFDHISFVGGRLTDSQQNTAVTSSVTTPNINIHRVGGTAADTNSGNLSSGTLRVALATNDVNASAMAASLSVIDDWDETDRAKVNPIVGQAGVQGNSGTVSANTQRVVLATDVALPAGTNAIGKLAANSGVDIGDVDVTSVIPGTGATNLGKAEDAGHTTGDTGVMMLGVRNDTLSQFSGTNADYTPIATEDTGRVYTRTALEYATIQQTFTGTGATGSSDLTKKPLKYYTLQVTETGTVTSWTVDLQVSLNGTSWTTLLSHTRAGDGSGTNKFTTGVNVALLVRANVSALTLGAGTNIIVNVAGAQ